ncbi:nucleoid-associated protein [Halomonas halocynthiae]|uniref:nucleoid-associated protein n=1 Tax=Halomonas halocynthiae TaxID=176290 RepID=UPI000407C85B|nr:nucleoid-associated protein [Halomonas halocynthiae]
MPILASIIHRIDKQTSDSPAQLIAATEMLPESAALEDLLASLRDAYHRKTKAWGRFDDSASGGLAADMAAYLEQSQDFVKLSQTLSETLLPLVDAHLPIGGHLLLADYQQGEARYLLLALLHHRDGFAIDQQLNVTASRQLNLAQMSLAARLDIAQWQSGSESHPYLSWSRDRGGKGLGEGLVAVLGASEQRDAGQETRTLLKAFSDYVEKQDLPEEESREKTDALVSYASEQAGRGEPIALDELSELIDGQEPSAFYEHIRHSDYGLSPEIPPDKRTISQFQRFTGRSDGVSISFDAHLLGGAVDYDEGRDQLVIRKIPKGLREQLKRRD